MSLPFNIALNIITYRFLPVLRYFSIVLQSLLLPSSDPRYYNSQASTYRADYNMADQVANDNTSTASENSQEMITATDLAKLRDNGKTLTPQELKELNTRIKALEEMAYMEDQLRALESRKRLRTTKSVLPDNLIANLQLEPRNSGYSQDY